MASRSTTLTIVLATVLPAVFVLGVSAAIWQCARKGGFQLFSRGTTPVPDEEIESWKIDRHDDEKEPLPEHDSGSPCHSRDGSSSSHVLRKSSGSPPASGRRYHHHHHHHHQHSSISSVQKPPSVIVYQNPMASLQRMSDEPSPRSFGGKYSNEIPQTPVLARAPNARPGLTDDAIQGDEPYIPQIKRQPSRLYKQPTTQHHHQPQSPSHPLPQPHHQRHISAFAGNGTRANHGDRWYGAPPSLHDLRSRNSADDIVSRGDTGHIRFPSDTSSPRCMSLHESPPGGLSPRPQSHQTKIGQAIG